jgi:tetratricopeptide (TPR) repeat protein
MLEKLTYVQAVLWMAARLADGLAHAHERGILHRDLKPANILLTDEGQPMLLDFNLSEDLKVRSGAAAAIGGTLPYMSPEHLDAFRGGACPVDARSDLYSIGVILYELLAGRRPFEIPDSSPDRMVLDRLIEGRLGAIPDIRRWNKAVTPAVESIIHHCLEPDPRRRYRNARELSEDLERHLAHRPLRYAPEPSLRERMTKWARRHPTLCSSTSIALLALILIVLLGAVVWFVAEHLREASARLQHGDFRAVFEECQFLLNTNGGPPEHLERGIRLARHTLDGYGVGRPGDWTTGLLVRRLPAAEQRALCEEVSELVLLEVRARITLAERSKSKLELIRSLQRGILWLDRVERFEPRPPAALYEDRGRFYAALGRRDLADRDRALASTVPPSSARDFYLLGTSLLARGRPDLAELPLSRAATLDARRFWAWFALGICHSDQGRHTDAAFDFSVSSTLAPDFAWPHLNRGLALARSGRLREARVAYDRALELNPDFTEALVDRALACLELGDWDQATRDLDRAIALGRRTPSVLAARAEALARLGRCDEAEQAFAEAIQADPNDPMSLVARGYSRLATDRAGAEADFARALDLDPRNARAHLGRAYLLRRDDLHAALAQVEMALNAEPNFGDALQLRALLRARVGDPAAEADVNRLLQVPTPRRLYNAACALALLSRSADDPRLVPLALDLLRRALDSGMPPACLADDPDLDALRESPNYSHLLILQR